MLPGSAGHIFHAIVSLPLIILYNVTLYIALFARYEHCIGSVPVYVRVTVDPLYVHHTPIIPPLADT